MRTEMLLGSDAMTKLYGSSVLVAGIGGVGGHATLALARAGVGHLTLVDSDTVSESNINRQAVAFRSTIGKPKVQVMKDMIADINPSAIVETKQMFYLPDTASEFDFTQYDYIIDCVDTVAAKLDIIERAIKSGVPVISAMGAGNKLDPAQFRVSDISKTEYCPLAKVVRRELRLRGINHANVCWSPEPPIKPSVSCNLSGNLSSTLSGNLSGNSSGNLSSNLSDKPVPGSISFVPSVCGLIMAGFVVRELSGIVTNTNT